LKKVLGAIPYLLAGKFPRELKKCHLDHLGSFAGFVLGYAIRYTTSERSQL